MTAEWFSPHATATTLCLLSDLMSCGSSQRNWILPWPNWPFDPSPKLYTLPSSENNCKKPMKRCPWKMHSKRTFHFLQSEQRIKKWGKRRANMKWINFWCEYHWFSDTPPEHSQRARPSSSADYFPCMRKNQLAQASFEPGTSQPRVLRSAVAPYWIYTCTCTVQYQWRYMDLRSTGCDIFGVCNITGSEWLVFSKFTAVKWKRNVLLN